MTVREVLEMNISKLQRVRVPLSEPDIYQAISNTMNDLKACVQAMVESEQAEAQEQATEQAEPEQQDGTEEG